MDNAFYFGCYEESGHYLFRPGPMSTPSSSIPKDFPVKPYGLLDGRLLRNGPQPQGVCTHYRGINGWTLISFWDRSVDSRGGSNSTFLCRGEHTFEEMLALFKEHFPTIVSRFKFPLVLDPEPGPEFPKRS
jgi:hypothetical protein